jgi:type II secretory pathway pseudopilin PulG
MASRNRSHAFSLIEAAIVLGVIGLVIGGIWVAAADLASKRRLNEAAEGMLTSVQNARALLEPHTYPSTFATGVWVGQMLNAARAYPPGWTAQGNHAISPAGVRIEITQGCWTICPMLSFRFYGPGHATYGTELDIAECTYLTRRLINILGNRDDFLYLQSFNPTSTIYNKPINPDTFSCTSNTLDVGFWFTPR